MKWNWEKSDWRSFKYSKEPFRALEAQFLKNSGILMGAFEHLNETDREELTISIITEEALKTSEIEGEYLNRDSLQTSICKHLGIKADKKLATKAEQGISELLVDNFKSYKNKLTHYHLFSWHKMVLKGNNLSDVGCYRTSKEPMRVVSGEIHNPKIHFVAPPSSIIKSEMVSFLDWFNESKNDLNFTLIRASISHLYFLSIHPFEDGNGRIARAISQKSLCQSLDYPAVLALSYQIESNKKDYYSALENSNKSNEITGWLLYFSKTIIEAQLYTIRCVKFLIEKTKLYDRTRNKINPRQEKVIKRLFKEGVEGFKGGLSAKNYIAIAKTSASTATRDLSELVKLEVLTQTGERRYTRYFLNINV
jgi:Fic family protein